MKVEAAMMRAVLLTLVFALSVAVSRAQNAPDSQECTLAGTVVDAISQQPVQGVTVSARSFVASGEAAKVEPVATDSTGRFSFEHLPPGRYFVLASHQGYVNQGPSGHGPRRSVFDLASGQRLDGVVIYLMPGGIVSGQISTADGNPVSGVTVQALKRSHRFGKPEFDEIASGESNKSGVYSIAALPAGDYYLRAVPSQEQKPDTKGNVYAPTYFPGTRDQGHSTLLTMRAGEQMAGIDIALSRVRAASVAGKVIDAVSKSPINGSELTLLEQGDVTPISYSATADAKGNFELKGVPRGNYLLVAEKPVESENDKSMWGQKAVQVGDADVRNVELAIRRGVEVSGRILLDGKANFDLTRLTGVLEPAQPSVARGYMLEVENASVNPDGRFSFQNVTEGSYRINFFPISAGLYLKSVQNPDVLKTGVTVVRGQPVQSLELALSSGVARLEGTVMNDQQPFPGATVVLVPDAELRSQPRYYRQTISDRQGRFSLQNLIPGDYEVFAWQDVERGSYLDPDFLAQFEDEGKAVSLKQGATLNLQLDVIVSE